MTGELTASLPESDGGIELYNINAGDAFGHLSALTQLRQGVDISVSDTCRKAQVFATDFNFGAWNDFSIASLETKIIYYRHVVDSLRWKLDQHRTNYPNHCLANSHLKIPGYIRQTRDIKELHALHGQYFRFSKLLAQWNRSFQKEVGLLKAS